jgi:hypothetical protein
MSTQDYDNIFRLIDKLERKQKVSWRDVVKLREYDRQIERCTYFAFHKAKELRVL